MKKQTKGKWKKKLLIPLLLFAGIAALAILGYLLTKPAESPAADTTPALPVSANTIEEPEENYILETSFHGEKELSPLLFAYPFQKTQYYIRNKEFVTLVPEEKVSGLQERAATILNSFFTLNGNDVACDYEKYEEEVSSYCLDNDLYSNEMGMMVNSTEYVSDYLKLIADAGLQMEVQVETDPSLVWEDNAYYVRGLCTFTVYSINDGVDTTSFFPVLLELGKTYQAVIDLGIVPIRSMQVNTFCISQMDWMYIEEVQNGKETDSFENPSGTIIVQ